MTNAREVLKRIPQELKNAFVAERILTDDPAGENILLDQDELMGHIRTSKTYLEILGSPGFENFPLRDSVIEFETEFIATAITLAKTYGLDDSFFENIKPTQESREAILRAIALASSGKLHLPIPSTNKQTETEKK